MHATQPAPFNSSVPPFDNWSFAKYVKDIGREYKQQAIKLITFCRTFVQAQKQTHSSYDELRSVLQVVDDALYSVTEARKKTTKDADAKFNKATEALSAYERKYHQTETVTYTMVQAGAKDKSSSTTLKKLKETLRPLKEEPTRIVEFFLQKSLPDKDATIVKQALSPSSNTKEILWNFSRYKDGRRLTLKDNPHFYEKLPTSAEKYGGQFQTDPVEIFREKISVLTDNPDLTGRFFFETAKKRRAFGNVWAPKEAIIFKDVCGRLEGENIIGSAIENTPNLWCFEESSLFDASWPSSPDQSSPSPTTTATPTTSPTGALLWDWRQPVLRMLRSQGVKFNIRISDQLPTGFSFSDPGSSLPNPEPNFSSIVDGQTPTLQFRPALGIQIPGAHPTYQPPSSYKTAQSIPLSQLPPAVELPSGSPTPLSPKPPILPTPASNVAPPTGPAVEPFPDSPAPPSPEPPKSPTPSTRSNAADTSLREVSQTVPNLSETEAGTASIFSQTQFELHAAGVPARRPAINFGPGVTTNVDTDFASGLFSPPKRPSVVETPPKSKPNRTWIQKCVHAIKKTVNTLRT